MTISGFPGWHVSELRLEENGALRAEEGSHLCIVHMTADSAGGRRKTLSVSVAPHAAMTVVSVVPSDFSASLYLLQHGTVEAGGKIHWWNAVFGGTDVRHELVSEVVGERGESAVDWLFFAHTAQHYDFRIKNLFSASHGRGDVTIKGAACDSARVTCQGRIVIGERGCGTSTHLAQHMLMLDASAKVDVVPALEITTNDVKASHSATVTKVPAENLFYMESRGIPQEEARRLCIEGFLADIIGRLPVASLRDELYTVIRGSYGQSAIG